jgi:chromatin segregation and condensation protein Rec8/ScpA/Scc1 (kleisin family)
LYDLPAATRALEAAAVLLQPKWERLVLEPEVAGLFADEAKRQTWLSNAGTAPGYFSLEEVADAHADELVTRAQTSTPASLAVGEGLHLPIPQTFASVEAERAHRKPSSPRRSECSPRPAWTKEWPGT